MSLDPKKIAEDLVASLDGVKTKLDEGVRDAVNEAVDEAVDEIREQSFADRHPVVTGLGTLAGALFLAVAAATAGANLGRRVANIGRKDPL